MTVKELIEKLKEVDPELRLFVRGYEGGVDDAGFGQVSNFALDYHTDWYYGSHLELDEDEVNNSEYKSYKIVKGIQL